jgi:hypothetical protein
LARSLDREERLHDGEDLRRLHSSLGHEAGADPDNVLLSLNLEVRMLSVNLVLDYTYVHRETNQFCIKLKVLLMFDKPIYLYFRY